MSTRHDLYHHFGPHVIEAIVLVLFKEINKLRENAGLPTYTVQQMIDAVKSEYDAIPPCDWEDQQ